MNYGNQVDRAKSRLASNRNKKSQCQSFFLRRWMHDHNAIYGPSGAGRLNFEQGRDRPTKF